MLHNICFVLVLGEGIPSSNNGQEANLKNLMRNPTPTNLPRMKTFVLWKPKGSLKDKFLTFSAMMTTTVRRVCE